MEIVTKKKKQQKTWRIASYKPPGGDSQIIEALSALSPTTLCRDLLLLFCMTRLSFEFLRARLVEEFE